MRLLPSLLSFIALAFMPLSAKEAVAPEIEQAKEVVKADVAKDSSLASTDLEKKELSYVPETICPTQTMEIPCHSMKCDDDEFLEGYLQALVDIQYYEYRVRVKVRRGEVFLTHLPCNSLIAQSIMTYIGDHPCIDCVYAVDECEEDCCDVCENMCEPCGVWFPQNSLMFMPLVADPRQISYSVAYRWGDIFDSHVTAVSFGDEFPIYRWRDVWPFCGDAQLSLEGGVWAVFETDRDSAPLVNADWYLGLPLTYAIDAWAFRLRLWHLSSHIGDEFLLNHPKFPNFVRVNPSRETLDLFASYQFSPVLRGYFGGGFVFMDDRSYKREGPFFAYGTEVRLLNCRSCCKDLYGTPFFAMHIKHWHDPNLKKVETNRTFALGYEFSKLSGIGRKLRVFVEYHEGFSEEGQFSIFKTSYIAAKMSYGF